MIKISAADIRQGYTPEKAHIDLVSHFWIYFVVRRVSFRLTPLFINLGFSANAVTALGLLSLTSGLVLIALGTANYFHFIVGAVLVNTWILFDCIDGDVARFRGQSSKFGALFDFLVGFVYHTILPICLGVGLYFAGFYSMIVLGYEIPKRYLLIAALIELFCGMFRKVVSLQTKYILGFQTTTRLDPTITVWKILPRAIVSFKAPLLFVASIAGLLGHFLFAYAVYNTVSLATMIMLSLKKALSADRQRTSRKLN